jgi:hypothetical protein
MASGITDNSREGEKGDSLVCYIRGSDIVGITDIRNWRSRGYKRGGGIRGGMSRCRRGRRSG